MNNFDKDLDKNSSNFVPLSPLSFISRVKDIYPKYESLVYGNRSYNPDGSTKVKNIAYKDASRGFLFADSCPPYGVCPRCAPYRINGY